MKPLYDEEVARELGYQKYWPELHDWVFTTAGVLVFGIVCVGGLVAILYYFNLIQIH